MTIPENASLHDKGHLMLFGLCAKFASDGDKNGARHDDDWKKDRTELMRLGPIGTLATLRAMEAPDDEDAENLMHQLADDVMEITEKYILHFPESFQTDYFETLADADLQSEFEDFD